MISQITKIHATGTPDQFKNLDQMCEMSESLFARTLAERIEGLSAADALPFICSWFQSVRHMGQAALLNSGIQFTVDHGASQSNAISTVLTPEERLAVVCALGSVVRSPTYFDDFEEDRRLCINSVLARFTKNAIDSSTNNNNDNNNT